MNDFTFGYKFTVGNATVTFRIPFFAAGLCFIRTTFRLYVREYIGATESAPAKTWIQKDINGVQLYVLHLDNLSGKRVRPTQKKRETIVSIRSYFAAFFSTSNIFFWCLWNALKSCRFVCIMHVHVCMAFDTALFSILFPIFRLRHFISFSGENAICSFCKRADKSRN